MSRLGWHRNQLSIFNPDGRRVALALDYDSACFLVEAANLLAAKRSALGELAAMAILDYLDKLEEEEVETKDT